MSKKNKNIAILIWLYANTWSIYYGVANFIEYDIHIIIVCTLNVVRIRIFVQAEAYFEQHIDKGFHQM